MHTPRVSRVRSALLVGCSCLLAAGCLSVTPTNNADPSASAGAQGSTVAAGSLFDSSAVHSVSLAFDQAELEAMLTAYEATGDKNWLEATVTIDGTTYHGVGIRLKGNSSLRGLTGGAIVRGDFPGGEIPDDVVIPDQQAEPTETTPETLPWLVSLDRFVDGQNHHGVTEFVVRSNSSETALNEALALDLLERAGLASQDAVAVRLEVNGGDDVLRLVIEHPNDEWMDERFDATGALYKAESTGNYSYRGDDPNAYDEVFDQEAGSDNTDLTPLIAFLDFINNSDDATFAAEIEQRLDADAFATYLAMQELLDNFDDIDGPGNNSYLYYDSASGQFTVVPWDYNLALGTGMGAPGGPNGGPDGGFQPPDGFPMPSGDPPFVNGEGPVIVGPGGGGPRGGSNILVERFTEIDEYAALIADKQAELEAQLFDSGVAAAELAEWMDLLKTQASDVVDAATVDSEAAQITSSLTD